MEDEERLRIVLKQFIENNQYLSENYRKWSRIASAGGLDAIAKDIDEAGQLIQIATLKLRSALNSMGS